MSSSGLEFPDFNLKSEVAQTLEPPLFLPLLVSTKPRPTRQGLWCHHPFLPMWLLHRLLESQLQAQKRSYENEAEALRGEIQSLKEENNRQQQLLAQNLQLPPEARIEASLQHEITRLTNENLVRAWLSRVPHTVTLSLSRDGVRKIGLCWQKWKRHVRRLCFSQELSRPTWRVWKVSTSCMLGS